MNKKLIAIAVTSALVAPGLALADDAKANGFVDIIYKIQDEPADVPGGKNPNQGKFGADGEVDFSVSPADGVTARVDANLDLSAGATSGGLEQGFFAWAVTPGVTVLGGVFNDPIGQDAEDAPDMNFTSHTAVYNILNHQTALTGNNVAGVAAAGALGRVNVTVGLLNDLGQADEKNSLALVLGGSPLENLKLEFGYVTHDTQDLAGVAQTAGNVWDLNGTYSTAGFTVGVDYLAAEEIVDAAYNVWGGYDFGNGFGVKVRYDSVGWTNTGLSAGVKDVSSTTVYASYQAAKNLAIGLEVSSGDNGNFNTTTNTDSTIAQPVSGIGDGSVATLEFIATF